METQTESCRGSLTDHVRLWQQNGIVLCGGEELVAMLRISLFEAPAVGVEVAGKDLSHAFTRPVLIASSNLEQK